MNRENYFVLEAVGYGNERVVGPLTFDQACDHIEKHRKMHNRSGKKTRMQNYRVIIGHEDEDLPDIIAEMEEAE